MSSHLTQVGATFAIKEAVTTNSFKEKLIARRGELGLSQAQLSEKAGIGKRTITSYETDGRLPHPAQLYKLARALDVSPEYLKNDDCNDPHFGAERTNYIEDAYARFGASGARDVERLLSQNAALFAGGELSEEAKDAFFQAVMKAYIDCKEKAKETYGQK